MTTELKDNYVEGHVYPYGKPGQVTCAGVLWLDPSGQAQFNAILDIRLKISVTNIWGHFHLKSGQLTIPNIITFKLSSANTFKRNIPKKMREPPRHNNVLVTDVERAQMLVRLGQVIPPEEKRILFQEGLTVDDKLAAVARDPRKAQLYNRLLLEHHKSFL